jgi:hypothetical protein
VIVFNTPPAAGCDDQRESDPGVARAESTVVAVHHTAAMGRPNAERAVMPSTAITADIVAADEPAGLAGEPVAAATCVESLETSCSDDEHRFVDATLSQRVRAVCESVLRFCESRLGFGVCRSEKSKAESADGLPAIGGGGRVESSEEPNI